MRLEAPQMRKKTTKRETQKNLSLNRKSKKTKERKPEMAQVSIVFFRQIAMYDSWLFHYLTSFFLFIGAGGPDSEKEAVPLVDYIHNVMKFVDAILSNNATDDHCRLVHHRWCWRRSHFNFSQSTL